LVEAAQLPQRQVDHDDHEEHHPDVEQDPPRPGEESVARHPAPTVPAASARGASADVCECGAVSTGDVFPDRGMEHRDKVAWMVEQHGWAFEPVPAHPELDPPIPGYGYTIGVGAAFAYPEIVVFGLTPVATRGLLGLVVDLLRGGTEIPTGAVFTGLLDNGLRSALLPVDQDESVELLPAAQEWYGG